jgi:hypothetical protein
LTVKKNLIKISNAEVTRRNVAGDMSKECTPMKTKSMLFFGFGKLKGKN